MRKTNRKTWLKITEAPDMAWYISMSFSDADVDHKKEVIKNMLVNIAGVNHINIEIKERQ